MLFDVHAHLTFPQFDEDRGEVVRRASEKKVSIVNSVVGLQEVEKAAELARQHDNVYWTLGCSASELSESMINATIDAIKKHKKGIVGIGEVGLDYHWVKDEAGRERERVNFKRFIELSIELGLPLVVHTRDAEKDAIDMLSESGRTALLHCFSGGLELAEKAVDAGHVISIPTNVVYVKSRQKLAGNLPLESIVLETDAPYLAPVAKARNEPANIEISAGKIARLRGISEGEVAAATTQNAMVFYQLK